MEGFTSGDRRIYVNQARRELPPNTFTSPPTAPTKPITFSDADSEGVIYPHNDPLVITIPIG
ncbi:hypothetical protein, partial [Alteromonas stellipolaris]|uniref:hypothetical protein n=1 Tax=Alteromonas stellipolaris TaxID=233316 RepID=UPI001D66A536